MIDTKARDPRRSQHRELKETIKRLSKECRKVKGGPDRLFLWPAYRKELRRSVVLGTMLFGCAVEVADVDVDEPIVEDEAGGIDVDLDEVHGDQPIHGDGFRTKVEAVFSARGSSLAPGVAAHAEARCPDGWKFMWGACNAHVPQGAVCSQSAQWTCTNNWCESNVNGCYMYSEVLAEAVPGMLCQGDVMDGAQQADPSVRYVEAVVGCKKTFFAEAE